MSTKLAALTPSKPVWFEGVRMDPSGAGEFRFITKAVTIEPPEEGGKRRFKMIASSTVVDEGKDEVKLSALHDLEQAFKAGRNIFTDHSHTVDNVFGRSDTAQIMDSGMKDPKTGAPIFDLHIAGVVNEPDPRMVRLADSIDGGYVTFGASIGARVLDHQRNKAGGMDIYHLDGKEASLVGIPMNQRSWTYKAAKAAEALEAATDESDDAEDEAVIKGDDDDDKTRRRRGDPDEVSTDIPAAIPAPKAPDEASETPAEEAPETSPETEDGQESESAPETPETASPETEDDTDVSDTPTEEKAFAFESDDVVKLASHVRDLAEAVNAKETEIETLKAERDRLTAENDLAKEVIEKMVAMPLRSKTAGYVEDTLSKRLPSFLAPEVRDFLTKHTSGE